MFLIGLYIAAAIAGSHIPANADWKESKNGIPIFVETNGVHVSLIVPISEAGEDLSDLIRPEDLSDPMLYGTHAMIGWGQAGVYRNAPTWADVRSGDVVSATLGSDETILHIYHLVNPQPNEYRKMLHVNRSQYKNIIDQIRANFNLDDQRRSKADPGYGANDLFYDSHGHYSAINTCNNWTGRVLKNAGVRVGIWTPLAGGVMRWF